MTSIGYAFDSTDVVSFNGELWHYSPTTIMVSGGAYGTEIEIRGIVSPNTKKGEVREMRGLFEVFVVDPEEGEIVFGDVVVAKDKEMAKLKVLQACEVPLDDLDDFDIICNRLGDVRKKKEIAEVRVVKDD